MACLSDTLLDFLIKTWARAEGPTGSHAHEEVDELHVSRFLAMSVASALQMLEKGGYSESGIGDG